MLRGDFPQSLEEKPQRTLLSRQLTPHLIRYDVWCQTSTFKTTRFFTISSGGCQVIGRMCVTDFLSPLPLSPRRCLGTGPSGLSSLLCWCSPWRSRCVCVCERTAWSLHFKWVHYVCTRGRACGTHVNEHVREKIDYTDSLVCTAVNPKGKGIDCIDCSGVYYVYILFVSACPGHTPLDLDQSLCHLGVTTFLRYFLSSLGRHYLV